MISDWLKADHRYAFSFLQKLISLPRLEPGIKESNSNKKYVEQIIDEYSFPAEPFPAFDTFDSYSSFLQND